MLTATKMIRPSRVSVVMMIVITSPLWMLVAYFLYNSVWYAAIFSAGLGLYVVLDVATSCIRYTDREIRIYRFYHLENKFNIEGLNIKYGRGGDIGVLPVLIVRPEKNAKPVFIKRTYYRETDLTELTQWIKSHGGSVSANR